MDTYITIKDNNNIILITYEDLLKYHGYEMVGGVALAFQMMRWAFPQICDGIPERGNFYFYSGMGKNAKGVIDAVEMVMRVKTYESLNLDIDYSLDKEGPLAPGGGKYYFEVGYCDKKLCLAVKDGLIPDEFIEYSKLAHHCKSCGIQMKDSDRIKLMQLRAELAESILKSNIDDLFYKIK